MEFNFDEVITGRSPSDDLIWDSEKMSDDSSLLMRVLAKLKSDADNGTFYFFEGMHDANGIISPLITEEMPAIVPHEEDSEHIELLEMTTVPWDITGKKIWEWDGAVYSLQFFLIQMCDFDEEIWTIDYLEEIMSEIHKGHLQTKKVMKNVAEESGFDESALAYLISCLADMGLNDHDELMTDSWAVCCVLHNNASSLAEAMYWTQDKTREALNAVKSVMMNAEDVIT